MLRKIFEEALSTLLTNKGVKDLLEDITLVPWHYTGEITSPGSTILFFRTKDIRALPDQDLELLSGYFSEVLYQNGVIRIKL